MLRKSHSVWFFLLVLLFVGGWQTTVRGQIYYPRAVGGILVDAQGLLENAQPDMLGKLAKMRAEALQPIPQGLKGLAELRKVSLRQIDATLQECLQQKKPIPDDLFYLGGLQQIRYIFVYPEQHDIVLVGPGEGWKVDSRGNVVGITTGRPVMLLDDLVVALRSARQAAEGGIRCSIDPTPEGMARLQNYARTVKRVFNIQEIKSRYEELLGMQQVTIAGVPPTSHFARVLVAADYRMKRIAMNFEPAPPTVKLPSYLKIAPTTGISTPRFWLEPKYEPVLRDADGMAWELRGAGVKALTEEDFFNALGQQVHQGRAIPAAQKWADLMTDQYAALAVAEPIFGQLRNCMELAVVSALLVKERLPEKAEQSLPVLLQSDELKPGELPAPKQVATQVSVIQRGGKWGISASGGVSIQSWFIADKTEQSQALDPVRVQAAPQNDSTWWWD